MCKGGIYVLFKFAFGVSQNIYRQHDSIHYYALVFSCHLLKREEQRCEIVLPARSRWSDNSNTCHQTMSFYKASIL